MKHSTDKDKPALILEIIADRITRSPSRANALCKRAQYYYADNAAFREAFVRRDEREVMHNFMAH